MLSIFGRKKALATCLLSTALCLSGTSSFADISSTAEFEAYLKALAASAQTQKNVYLPGVSHAVVAPHGTGFASATIWSPRGATAGNGPDGSVGLGFGIGNADKNIGASISVNITGTVPFGSDGDFTLKLSKSIGSGTGKTFVGATIGRLGGWGANAGLTPTAEVAITHFGNFQSGGGTPFMVTVGYGGSTTAPVGFAGLGVGLTKNLGLGVSTKNGTITAGLGYIVPNSNGMSANLDVTGGGSSATTVTFGVSYSIRDLF